MPHGFRVLPVVRVTRDLQSLRTIDMVVNDIPAR